MNDLYLYYPLLAIGAAVGILSIIFSVAYAMMKNKKEEIGFDRAMTDGEIIRRLFAYARPYKWSFLAIILIMLVSICYDVFSPILIGRIEYVLSSDFEMSELLFYVAVYASILVVSLVSGYVQAIILQKIGQKILSALREDTFSHIESLSHAQLSTIPVGKLVTRVTNDTGAISMMFTNLLVNLFKNCAVIVGVLAAMLCLNYMLTLMVLSFVPFVILFTVIFRKFSRSAYRRVKDATTDINTFLSEHLSGIKVIQIFGREKSMADRFEAKNRALGRAKERQIFVFGIFRPTVYMLYLSSVMALLYLGGMGYVSGMDFLGQTISADVLVSFYLFISKFYNPIQSLAEQFNRLQSALASAEKIFTVLDMQPEIVDSEDAVELDRIDGNIEFRNVWFAYEGEEWVLRDVSFKVEAGSTVAFVGATGSGKTTILSLICRNYEVQRGEILIDGVNVKKIRLSSLRRHFGQMLQDVFLFSGTVRSNVVLRDESITDDEVERTCRYVNASHFIKKLAHGLDEEIRERGNNLSAGQRQLLSFARTLAHKPSVMILDEATANIDTETEQLISDSLYRMMDSGTMLMVAHRLSTIRRADNIIVLDHGVIVESGTHAELIAREGRYHSLYTLQFEKQRLLGESEV